MKHDTRAPGDAAGESAVVLLESYQKKRGYRAVKRLADVLLAGSLLLAGSPLLLLLALCIRCDSRGPALFRQTRLGQYGRPFVCLKFRTMRQNAPDNLATAWQTEAERYITRLGFFLRRSSLDELPQLWNVLKGEMSLVGYRPVIPAEKKLNGRRAESGVFSAPPGLTGWAQIHGRDELGWGEKAQYDREYVERAGLRLDGTIFLRSIGYTLRGKGISDRPVNH